MPQPPNRRALVRIARGLLLLQVAYLGAYVGWRWTADPSAAGAQAAPTLASALFSPIEQLGILVLSAGDQRGPSPEQQIQQARQTLQQMGHQVPE